MRPPIFEFLDNPAGGFLFDQLIRKYKVDFSQVPPDTETINTMLATLRIPQFLPGNRTWYVDPVNGTDTYTIQQINADVNVGKGLHTSRAFKTPQVCLDFVAANFNINTRVGTIQLLNGTHPGFTLPSYPVTTGRLQVFGEGLSTLIASTTSTRSYNISAATNAGLWYVENMKLQQVSDGNQIQGASIGNMYVASGCLVYIRDIHMTTNVTGSYDEYLYMLRCGSGGAVHLLTNNTIERLASSNKATAMYGGLFGFDGRAGGIDEYHLTIKGNFSPVIDVTNREMFERHVLNLPRIAGEGQVTGKRYNVRAGALIDTKGGGPNFFPGDAVGTVDSANFGAYK